MPIPPPIPSKINRPPGSLAASYRELPTLARWRADTPADRVGERANDAVLRFIDGVVEALQHAIDGEELYLLGQLFFSTMSWINHCQKSPLMAGANRRAVLSLNLYAGNALAAGLECSIGQLATRMQELYGVGMSQHGIDTDAKEKPRYFDAAKREVYRVFVVNRLLCHYRSAAKKFVLLDSSGVSKNMRPGYGFVLSMSNELLVGNFATMSETYHSTFMAGSPVQCAGMIQLKRGVVTHIKNDSGHYKPVDQALVKALLFLRMHGLDVDRIVVACEPKKLGDSETETTGADFLRANGNWEGIRARAAHQSRL